MGLRRWWTRKLSLIGITLLTFVCVTLQPAVSVTSPVAPSAISPVDNALSNFPLFSLESASSGALSDTSTSLLLGLSTSPLVSPDTSAIALLQDGQQQYESGKIAAALDSWQKAAARLADDSLQQAIALSYVSIAAQDLGEWAQAETSIAQALSLLAEAAVSSEVNQVKAQILNAQGRLLLKQGKPEMAWEIWTQAEAAYVAVDDMLGQIGTQINQSQSLQTMGLYRRARLQLETIAKTLQTQPDSKVKAIALKSLGTVFQTAGSLPQSKQYLLKSLALYEQLDNGQLSTQREKADVVFALANTLRLMQEREAAEERYQEVEALVPHSVLQTRSQLNRFSLLLEMQQWPAARQLLPNLMRQVAALPSSRQAVYSRVNLVESLLTRGEGAEQPMSWLSVEAVAELLSEGLDQAKSLQDRRAQAFSLGELSKLYAFTQQWSESQLLAQQALTISQNDNAQDMAYRWQQQLAQAYHQQGQDEKAIATYTEAIDTLSIVRRDLLATNADVQYSFRETVEPVYRELVSLLLLPEDASQSSLTQARNVIEELQLAEMENYFRSACVDSASESIDKLDAEAAVIYPIVLPDRIEVVLSLPNLPLRHYRVWQTEAETNQVIGDFYRYLNPILSEQRRLAVAKQIYDWLITPAEPALVENEIQTLVFVLDGQFRRIPMTALHNGQQYLLERYGVALTPGLRLLGPHFQNPKPLQALMLGLSESRGGFSALPGVKTEIEQVAASVNAEVIFNEDFTREKLAAEVDRLPYPVLHLATHGQFSSDLEETFLLAWDQKISVGDLDSLLRDRRVQQAPIELMVLSACKTAEGDDRAALGLAGMALRSGARSTLATLWSVNDSSTAALMTAFYEELSNAELSKAEALRRAQIKILQNPEYSHPYYWSPFVLIGNWLS